MHRILPTIGNIPGCGEKSWRPISDTSPHAGAPQGLLLCKKIFLFPFRMRYGHAIPFVEGGKILDIGCGNGTELYKLKAMGWETYGVEMDAQASERARSKGIRVYTGDLFGANFPDQFFHVVRMSFVLEHLPNPRETLQEIRRILRPRGTDLHLHPECRKSPLPALWPEMVQSGCSAAPLLLYSENHQEASFVNGSGVEIDLV